MHSLTSIITFFYHFFLKYIMSLHLNPFSPHHHIQFQREEPQPVGCCLGSLYTQPPESHNPAPKRHRFLSEPKEPKNRKIDIVTPRRGLSSQRNTYLETERTASKEKSLPQAKLSPRKSQRQKLALTLSSKVTTHRTSRQTSKVSFNKDLRQEYPSHEGKQSCITTRNTTKPIHSDSHQLHPQELQPSIAFVSQISLVEEEFISHGSQQLQALNFIAQIKKNENRENAHRIGVTTFKREKLNRPETHREVITPFFKLGESNIRFNPQGHKRLIL